MNDLRPKKKHAAAAPYMDRRVKIDGRDGWEIVRVATGEVVSRGVSDPVTDRLIEKIVRENSAALARLAKK